MRKRCLLLVLFLYCSFTVLAQRENDKWAFGRKEGLNFSSGMPVHMVTACDSREPGGAVSSRTGRFLFYTDGRTVFDITHTAMPNGTGLTADLSTTQGVVIVPFVDDTNRYFVFTINGRDTPPPHYLRYSVVDMTRNGGLGDVDPARKNIIIDSNMTEKMAVAQGKGCYNWLLVHTMDTTANFHAFKIDVAGLHSTPVISYCGSGGYGNYLIGEMKVSPDDRMIAAGYTTRILLAPTGVRFTKTLELNDFDDATGKVSNARVIDTLTGGDWQYYGAEFSPDNSKLYFASAENFGVTDIKGVIQYDLSLLPSMTAVRASRYIVFDGVNCMGLRTGPDNKIYIARLQSSPAPVPIGCIRSPDLAGAACNPTTDIGISVGFSWTFGMPIVPYRDTVRQTIDTLICTKNPSVLLKAPEGYLNYKWNDGDTARSKLVTASGTKMVYMDMGPSTTCGKAIYTYNITLGYADTTSRLTDTSICFKATPAILLEATPGYDRYRWQDADTNRKRYFSAPGVYYISGTRGCSIHTDSFVIQVQQDDTLFHTTDTTICFIPEVTLYGAAGYDTYTWNNGATGISRKLNSNTTVWVTAAKGCSLRTDTFLVSFINFNCSLGADTVICDHTEIVLDVPVTGASYRWQDGAVHMPYIVTAPGDYTLSVTVDGCTATDTLHISRKDFSVDLGPDTVICRNEQLLLDAGRDQLSYLWQDGHTARQYPVSVTGQYSLQIRDGACFAADTINITVVRCDSCMAIPNAFTPNNDQHNDIFRPFISCPVQSYAFKIFNRYGQEVFSTSDPAEGWDGRINKNEYAQVGVYYYLVKATFLYPQLKEQLFKGDVTVIR